MSEEKNIYCIQICIDAKDEVLLNKQKTEDRISRHLKSAANVELISWNNNFLNIHVHTDKPFLSLKFCKKFGTMVNAKINNLNKNIVLENPRDFTVVDFTVDSDRNYYIQECSTLTKSKIGSGEKIYLDKIENALANMNAKKIIILFDGDHKNSVPDKNLNEIFDFFRMNADDRILFVNKNKCGTIRKSDTTTECYDGFYSSDLMFSNSDKFTCLRTITDMVLQKDANTMLALYGKNISRQEAELSRKFFIPLYPSTQLHEINTASDNYECILIPVE